MDKKLPIIFTEKEDCTIYDLPNGNRYKVVDSKLPYRLTEQPSGGFVIWHEYAKGKWGYIDNSPNMECVNNFLKAALKNDPPENVDRSAEKLWDNFLDLLKKEKPYLYETFLSVECKDIFLRANSGEVK